MTDKSKAIPAIERLIARAGKAREQAPLVTGRMVSVPLADLVEAFGLEPEDAAEAKAFALYQATLATAVGQPDITGERLERFAASQWVTHTTLPGSGRVLRAHYRRLAKGDLTTNSLEAQA